MSLFAKHSHLGNASPSISMERGTYRMRAPITRPPPLQLEPIPQTKLHNKPVQNTVNRNLAMLVAILTLGCISCFGSAWYLYTTRWEVRSASSARMATNWTSSQQAIASDILHDFDPTRKYLSYLPHSGFHNQRIAFENALLLSYMLNRTLLVPPIRLGNKPIRYVDYNTLSRFHELSGKEGLQHCLHIPIYQSVPLECLQYSESSYVPWSWLINTWTLSAHQPLLYLPNMSQIWIQKLLNFTSADVYTLSDDSPYHFRFLDTPGNFSLLRDKYQADIYIDELSGIPQRLLRIGTLFGSSRILAHKTENIAHRQFIRQNMVFKHRDLNRIADNIARRLNHSFIGLHFRSGDGKFEKQANTTVKVAWWKILSDVLKFSRFDICNLEQTYGMQASPACLKSGDNERDDSLRPSAVPTSLISYTGKCRSPLHREQRYRPLNAPIYIATDLHSADAHPLLTIFQQTFPCLFFLQDFADEMLSVEVLPSPYDGVNLSVFSLPFLDALVLGRALQVVGTEGSTFSNFVKNILWPFFHN